MHIMKVVDKETGVVKDVAQQVEHTDIDEYGVTLYMDEDVFVVIGKEEMLDWLSHWMDKAGKDMERKGR